MSLEVRILSSGSKGNCTIIGGRIAIDAGLTYKGIEPYEEGLEVVLFTHRHSDHFRKACVKGLAKRSERLFGVPDYLVEEARNSGVKDAQIVPVNAGDEVRFNGFTVIPVRLRHDVPNQGYKIHLDSGERIFFATDTGSLDGIEAKNYDLYLVEANYTEADMRRRIWEKEVQGIYCYEYKARRNHLSKEACDAWLYTQMGSRSRYVYMHQHVEKIDNIDKEEEKPEDGTQF